MIVGLGTDIVEISRIEDSLKRTGERFAQRILTPEEMQLFLATNRKTSFLAKRFCIKEAAAKALGTGIGRGVSWQHMQVGHNDLGAPELTLSAGALDALQQKGGVNTLVTVADERHYATATVILTD